MSKFKRFIALAAAFCMFSVSAYAETKDVSYKVTVDGENVSVTPDSLTSDTDYSDLNVNVIKYVNEQKNIIYSGALGDYAGGAFTDVDFSKINFLLVVNFISTEPEAIYIIPTNTVNTVSETQSNMSLQSEKSEFFRLEDALDVEDTSGTIPKKIYDVSLLPSDYLEYMSELGSETGIYGDGSVPAPAVSYDYEITAINLRDNEDNSLDYLVNGGVLQSVTVESNGVDDDVILAVAEYNGYTLTKLTSYDITLSANKDVVMTNYALSNITENTSVKLFVWDSYWGTTPKANPITLFTENDMEISVNFMYDNTYTEKAFNRGKTIKAQINAKSTKWWSQALLCMMKIIN